MPSGNYRSPLDFPLRTGKYRGRVAAAGGFVALPSWAASVGQGDEPKHTQFPVSNQPCVARRGPFGARRAGCPDPSERISEGRWWPCGPGRHGVRARCGARPRHALRSTTPWWHTAPGRPVEKSRRKCREPRQTCTSVSAGPSAASWPLSPYGVDSRYQRSTLGPR